MHEKTLPIRGGYKTANQLASETTAFFALTVVHAVFSLASTADLLVNTYISRFFGSFFLLAFQFGYFGTQCLVG